MSGDSTQFFEEVVIPFWEKTGSSELVGKLRQLQKNGRELAIYGCGSFAHSLLRGIFNQYSLSPDVIVDRNCKNIKLSEDIPEIKVISPKEFFEKHREAMVIITTSRFLEETKRLILANGFAEDQIIDNFAIINDISERKIKHSENLAPLENEVYIDGGVLDGSGIKEFIEFCGGRYKKIYGFEPDPDSFSQSIENIRQNGLKRVEMINKGLWSVATTLSFNGSNTGGSKVDENGSIKIETATVDDTVGNDQVTLIKMDIEGAELEALKGAENIIQRDKPRLVISLYHKPEDILEIPLYIHSLVPEYYFYIRHKNYNLPGTELYAILEE